MEKNSKLQQILETCRENGITLETLLESITKSAKLEKQTESGETDKQCEVSNELRVTNLLKEIGVPAHIKGYHYLRYSIIYAMSHKNALDAITKILYPNVAREFETTSSRVERAMRHAIGVAWDRGDIDVFEKYFVYTISPDRGKPTNLEFIATLVDYLRLN